MSILSLPSDILSIIWKWMSMHDIAQVRQTCSALSPAIATDKQLWVHILDRDVHSCGLRLPSNLKDIRAVEARQVESWVKHAFLLDRSLKERNNKLTVHKMCIRQGLRITWLKTFLGRWCLVAASNEEESEMSLWEVLPNGTVRCVTTIYLEAPVINGIIDTSSGETHCAITLGTGSRCILVLGILQSADGVSFHQFASIPNSSHVRFLLGDVISFAVRDGDDAYPYYANWRTGICSILGEPENTPRSFLSFEPCKTVTVRQHCIFTLHCSLLRVFRLRAVDCHDTSSTPAFLRSFSLGHVVIDGRFLDDVQQKAYGGRQETIVRFIYQDVESVIHQGTIVMKDSEGIELHEYPLKNSPNMPLYRRLHFYALGSSGRTLFCSTSLIQRAWWNPQLFFARLTIPPFSDAFDPLQVEDEYKAISKVGLPLTHVIQIADFDDTYGLLLLGTAWGDVRLASILPEMVISPGSVQNELRSSIPEGVTIAKLSESPVPLNIPLYYRIQKTCPIENSLPEEHLSHLISKWEDSRVGTLTVGDWSNDWSHFDTITNWISPLSLWGDIYIDSDREEFDTVTFLRFRLQTLGDITPVLYCVSNHNAVIFRIGSRIFYSRFEGSDDVDPYEFEEREDGYLGILPLAYDEFQDNPEAILLNLSDRTVQSNLDSRPFPKILEQRLNVLGAALEVRDRHENLSGEYLDTDEMETWSDAEWDKHVFSGPGTTYWGYEEPPAEA